MYDVVCLVGEGDAEIDDFSFLKSFFFSPFTAYTLWWDREPNQKVVERRERERVSEEWVVG